MDSIPLVWFFLFPYRFHWPGCPCLGHTYPSHYKHCPSHFPSDDDIIIAFFTGSLYASLSPVFGNHLLFSKNKASRQYLLDLFYLLNLFHPHFSYVLEYSAFYFLYFPVYFSFITNISYILRIFSIAPPRPSTSHLCFSHFLAFLFAKNPFRFTPYMCIYFPRYYPV